jgi:hypothetical protein
MGDRRGEVMSDPVEDALLKRILARDRSAVDELVAYLKTSRSASFAIGRIEYYLARPDVTVDTEKLCDYVLRYGMSACPACASSNTSVHNYNMMWHDGDVKCDDCGTYVRMYDAG